MSDDPNANLRGMTDDQLLEFIMYRVEEGSPRDMAAKAEMKRRLGWD